MRSVYGKECEKHPELAGRRYLPNNNCIKCHSESMKAQHAKRKKAQEARDERLARCLALLESARYMISDNELLMDIVKELNHEIQ